jgi:hypothetical protein
MEDTTTDRLVHRRSYKTLTRLPVVKATTISTRDEADFEDESSYAYDFALEDLMEEIGSSCCFAKERQMLYESNNVEKQ